jgi:uncharacterized protein (DUF433 family)
MAKASRDRLQVELTTAHRRFLQLLGERLGGAGEADATRRALEVVQNLSDNIERGFKVVIVPAEDERPDALPELSRAFRPGSQYSYLVSRPHAWRKQLVFKGRRLTVGQFLHSMRVNNMSLADAAEDFDLPLEAAREAIEYGERYAALIAAEAAEDARVGRTQLRAATAG